MEVSTVPICGNSVSCESDFFSNSSENLTNSSLKCDIGGGDSIRSIYFRTLVYIMYISIFLIALVGNGLVCYVVFSSARMRTTTNYFIVNLAVGDILMTVFCVPFTFVATLLLQYWPFGIEMCPTVSFTQAVSVLVSAYTLVAISVDRYLAIMWPLKPRMTKSQAKVIILVVWCGALVTASPVLMTTQLFQPSTWYKNCNVFVCGENWPNPVFQYYYNMILMTLQYCVPFTVLIFTYSSIAVVVWGKQPPGEAQNMRDERMAKSKRKMIKMMLTVVFVFTVCWLPFNILIIIWERNQSLGSWSGIPYLWFASHWLAMSHSCYNPVIYCWMNARFRAGFCAAFSVVPGLKECATKHHLNANGSHSLVMTDHCTLHRHNTYSTYISIRNQKNATMNHIV